MKKNAKSVTLVELLIALMAASIMVLSFYGFVNYGTRLVGSADRRAKVQNGLSYCLEHMGKYVQKAIGNKNNPAMELTANGFRVRVDFRNPQVPSDLNGAWVNYSLAGNTLSVTCSGVCAAPFVSGVPESLSSKIMDGFVNASLPDPLPASPSGFYVHRNLDSNLVEIGLVGRYDPAKAIDPVTNPQVAMKISLLCNSSSTN